MMAPRKNTQSAEDSLKGAQPEQAEAEQQAAAPEAGQQQTGGSDEGDTGAAADQEHDAARAADSLKGAQPEQAEAEQQAATPETGQQQTGGSDEGDTGAAAGPTPDPAQAVLMAAVSSIGPDQAQVLPSTMEIRIQRRMATAASSVLHDLMLYTSGDPIPVSEADFTALSKAGAVIEDDWDDLAPEED